MIESILLLLAVAVGVAMVMRMDVEPRDAGPAEAVAPATRVADAPADQLSADVAGMHVPGD